jgi:ABC-type Fe3+/spermidine/putrescine transport system ATPase subunit
MIASQFDFRSVSMTYDRHSVLNGMSFTIPTGQHTAILGPSGCGKSTVLRLLAGLEAPSAGQILLDGKVVSESHRILRPPHLRGVAMVFQDLALWPNLSARQNVLLGLSGTGLTKQDARRRADEVLTQCGVAALGSRKPGTLSGGEQQRIALARAIAVHPYYLLLDEPFAGLDLVTKAALFKEIARLVAERSMTIVLVTHDPLEATALCSAVLVLKDGQVEEAGMLNDLLRTPRSEMLTAFRAQLSSAVFQP